MASTTAYKILLIDDDPSVLESVRQAVDSFGYEVETATSGEMGLTILKEKYFDIVLTDLIMEAADGLAVLKRSKEIRPEILVIILTGHRMLDAAVEAFRLGADDYLIKPFNMAELRFRIDGCIEKLESHRRARASEKALKRSEANFRALVESSVDHIFMLDLDGVFRFTNNNIEHLDITQTEHLLGSRIQDIYPHEVARQYLQNLHMVIQTHQPVTFEHPMRSTEGDFFHLDTLYPIMNVDELIAVGGICKDITSQKKLERQLFQSQKMEALGTLVAGVAHEINNPINLIMFNLPLLKKIWHDLQSSLERDVNRDQSVQYGGLTYAFLKDNLPQMIQDMEGAAQRVAKIVTGLKSFSRKTSPAEVKPVDINIAVQNAVNLIQTTSRKAGVALNLKLADNLPNIKANMQNIEQIVVNLAINAVQSIEKENGRVDIITTYVQDAGEIHLCVRDNGKGVDPDIADRIFNPFVTDKQESGGTGLGLSVTYGLVKDHGGEIDFESKKGRGTAFTVRLAVTPKPKPQRILVADDDAAVRRLIIKTLSRLEGCVFEKAENGTEALIKLGTFRPDVLILDVLMPEMDGLEVCRAIKKEPELSAIDVIIISGHLSDPRFRKITKLGFTNLYRKPLETQPFRKAVQAILERRHANGIHPPKAGADSHRG